MSNNPTILVEVAYASPEQQQLIAVTLDVESSAQDAIVASNILALCPEIDLSINKIGVFGKAIKKPETHTLLDGDRVEIYRPLASSAGKAKQ